MYDIIIIGAGIGGLIAASQLASHGKQVLILERNFFLGGSSSIFKRGDFIFPMGPLSFSYPNLVKKILKKVGIEDEIEFTRNHFQLYSPELNIIYSQEWNHFKNKLKKKFPEEIEGIEGFFSEFGVVLEATKNIIKWHPDFIIGKKREDALKNIENNKEKYNIINKYYKIPSKVLLNKYLNNNVLKKLLGSQGSYEPVMNVVHLAFLWNIMSIQGIWFPSCGINGINDLLIRYIIKHGGRIEKKKEVSKILIEDYRVVGVKTADKEIYKAKWIIADSDYKKIFLNLISPKFLPNSFLEMVKNTPYTESELCVYLGIDSNKIDLSNLRADHFFYRSKIEPNNSNPIDFQNKDIEVCLWSNKFDNLAPKGYISLILRVNMPYHYFKDWREGYFKRNKEYIMQKLELVNKLIKIVEKILPGLSSSIVQLEAATPLTYRDFIGRCKGSIAGWGRDTEKIRFNSKLLIETPIKKLLIVGIYSVIEPFLGGFPVSVYSGYLAANLILEREESK